MVTTVDDIKVTLNDDFVEKKQPKQLPGLFRNYWSIIAKCVELILILIVMTISAEPIKRTRLISKNYFHVQFFATVYGGYAIVLIIILIGKIIGDKFPYKTLTIFSYLGCILFIAAGTLTLADWNFLTINYAFHPAVHLTNLILISGIIDLSVAVIFALDGYHMMKQKQYF